MGLRYFLILKKETTKLPRLHVSRLYDKVLTMIFGEMSPEVAQVCADQVEGTEHSRWVYATDPSDYFFGDPIPTGIHLLDALPATVDETSVLLDIGSGQELFLREAVHRSLYPMRAIGFDVATGSPKSIKTDNIERVHGDFQRPRTWQPAGILTADTIDVAASSRTFRHFAHPLAALQNALTLLKQGGELFVDNITIYLEPSTKDDTAEIIERELLKNAGECGFRFSHNDETEDHGPCVKLRAVHLRRQTASVFDQIEPIVDMESRRKIMYKPLAGMALRH